MGGNIIHGTLPEPLRNMVNLLGLRIILPAPIPKWFTSEILAFRPVENEDPVRCRVAKPLIDTNINTFVGPAVTATD